MSTMTSVMGAISFQPTEFGGFMWLLGETSFVLRATDEMRGMTAREAIIPCPEQLGPALAEVSKAKVVTGSVILRMDVATPDGPMRAVRFGEVSIVGESVVPVDMQALYYHAVRATHGDVGWRASNGWSPIYALKGGAVVAMVMPLTPKALGAA